MSVEYIRSIDEKTQIGFKKVKEDVLFLNNRIENENIRLLNIIKELTARVEKLESQKMEMKKTVSNDLTEVNGIGPVISKILRRNNISTFEELSKTPTRDLKSILEDSKLGFHNPSTWPLQARNLAQ